MKNPFTYNGGISVGDRYYVYPTTLRYIYTRFDLDYRDLWTGEPHFHSYTDVIGMIEGTVCFLGEIDSEDETFWATRAGQTMSFPFSSAKNALRWLECPGLGCPPLTDQAARDTELAWIGEG